LYRLKKIELNIFPYFLYNKPAMAQILQQNSCDTAEMLKCRKVFVDKLREEGVETDPKVKIVTATYVFEVQSAWIVPADIDPDDLWIKYDQIHYGDKEIKFQQVKNGVEESQHYDFKRPDSVKICVFNDADMVDNDIYYDCADGYDEEILEKVKAELASLE